MPKFPRVWVQKDIPVIWRRAKGAPLFVRLPFDDTNRQWLQNGQRNKPHWNVTQKHWELPNTWFNSLVNRMLERYCEVYIIQPYREREICSSTCRNAAGHDCECSCMGKYHGSETHGDWVDVTDTFSIRWGDEHIAWRLLTKRSQRNPLTD